MIDISDCKCIADVCRKYIGNVTTSNKNKTKKLLEAEGIDWQQWLNDIKKQLFVVKDEDKVSNPTELGQKIYELRAQGKTYAQIAKELNCTKSAVSYWCSKDTRDDIMRRKEDIPRWKVILQKKLYTFESRTLSNNVISINTNWKRKLSRAVSRFFGRCNTNNMGYKEVLDKFGTNVKCYLTGRDIDITKDDYNLDHIIPVSKGGEGTIENMGFTIPIANASKSSMTLEEYLDLCEEVLRYHGRIK